MKSNLIFLFLLMLFLSIPHSANAQQWAMKMFQEKEYDFGRVALGSDVEHRFKFQNIYEEDVHVASVRSSCGCTSVSVTNPLLKTWETSEIVAKLNTSGQFTREKEATITVVFDQPIRAEVQLHVESYIRPDVVLDPGVVNFGAISEGKQVTKHLQLHYAGRNDWGLIDIRRNNPNIHVRATQTHRGNGKVSYDIEVTLQEDAPIGYVNDYITFITNDPNQEASQVVLPAKGLVRSPLLAKPSPLMIGQLSPGEQVTKNLILQSETPFRIEEMNSSDPRLQFRESGNSRKIHVVPVTFHANERTGKITSRIYVRTDLDAKDVLEIDVTGRVFASEEPSGDQPLIQEQKALQEVAPPPSPKSHIPKRRDKLAQPDQTEVSKTTSSPKRPSSGSFDWSVVENQSRGEIGFSKTLDHASLPFRKLGEKKPVAESELQALVSKEPSHRIVREEASEKAPALLKMESDELTIEPLPADLSETEKERIPPGLPIARLPRSRIPSLKQLKQLEKESPDSLESSPNDEPVPLVAMKESGASTPTPLQPPALSRQGETEEVASKSEPGLRSESSTAETKTAPRLFGPTIPSEGWTGVDSSPAE